MVHPERRLEPFLGDGARRHPHPGVVHEDVEALVLRRKRAAKARMLAVLPRSSALTSTSLRPVVSRDVVARRLALARSRREHHGGAALARPRAVSLPMPVLLPVTIQTLPCITIPRGEMETARFPASTSALSLKKRERGAGPHGVGS